MFSHDELIVTTALDDSSVSTAVWLQKEMKDLLGRELAARQKVLEEVPAIRVVVEEKDRAEEEVQCMHCNTYIYLSQVGCDCTTKVTCHDHISEVCNTSS